MFFTPLPLGTNHWVSICAVIMPFFTISFVPISYLIVNDVFLSLLMTSFPFQVMKECSKSSHRKTNKKSFSSLFINNMHLFVTSWFKGFYKWLNLVLRLRPCVIQLSIFIIYIAYKSWAKNGISIDYTVFKFA